jgi:sulfotransferase
MNKKYHFITGLPRSGSSLLVSILKQNPRFYASISDSLANVTKVAIENFQSNAGMKYTVSQDRIVNSLKGMVEGFYQDIDKEVIFNTNRAWTLLTPQINLMYPSSKFIVCVRDIVSILDSFERLFRANPVTHNTIVTNLDGNVYTRMDMLMDMENIVGFPYLGVKQAITSEESHKLMLVEYEHLCANPELILKSLYAFIDEPYFEHDFNNVEASWEDYDSEIGLPLHKVRKTISYTPRKPVLPPDLIKKYSNMEVWRL